MATYTCFVKKESGQYASLCVELDVASCGKTEQEAINGLRDAIETYVNFMTDEGQQDEIERPVPMNELKDFLFTQDDVSEQNIKAFKIHLDYAQEPV